MPAEQIPDAARRVLIFDFDGVVVDTEWVHFESWCATLHEAFGARPAGDYTQIVGRTMDELYQTWVASGIIPAGLLDEALKRRLLARKTERYFEIGAERLSALPGVADLVNRAQSLGWYAAIASRGRRIRLLRTLAMARLPAVFELVLSSEDIVDRESDRKVHARAAHMLGADPAHCIVVEDSASGVADARDSGIGWVVGLTTSVAAADLYGAGADQVVDSLDEISLLSLVGD